MIDSTREGGLRQLWQAATDMEHQYHLELYNQQEIWEAVGLAHLAVLDIPKADRYFQRGASLYWPETLAEVARWCAKYPEWIKENDYGFDRNYLVNSVIPHMRLCQDTEGFYLHHHSLDFIVQEIEELGENPQGLFEEVVRNLERAGNHNIPKRLLLAEQSGNGELIRRTQREYDVLAQGRRLRIDESVQAWAEIEGYECVDKLQGGDHDDFFPIANHLYLIQKDGQKYVLKENQKLYVDFSRLDGYNSEKEVYERIADSVGFEHIIQYHGDYEIDGIEFLLFDYFDGQDLSNYTTPDNLLDRGLVLDSINKISKLLGQLHEAGIMYMDVKAKNFMINEQGQIKMLDFGMARLFDEPITDYIMHGDWDSYSLELPKIWSVYSTPRYQPPEWTTSFRVTGNSEVFQLGIMTYELLTGRHPFATVDLAEGDNCRISEILKYSLANVYNDYIEAPEVDSNQNISDIVQAMLEKRPNERLFLDAEHGFFEGRYRQ
jgi:serine/threonine protein kinase